MVKAIINEDLRKFVEWLQENTRSGSKSGDLSHKHKYIVKTCNIHIHTVCSDRYTFMYTEAQSIQAKRNTHRHTHIYIQIYY